MTKVHWRDKLGMRVVAYQMGYEAFHTGTKDNPFKFSPFNDEWDSGYYSASTDEALDVDEDFEDMETWETQDND